VPTERERAYARQALADEVAKLAAMQPGSGRNQGLNDGSLRMGGMIAAGWIDRKIVEDALWEASRINGYRAKDGDQAAWNTMQSGLTAGMKNPHPPLLAHPTAPRSASGDRAVVRRVADVHAEPVRWLWPGRFAIGKLSILAGDPGVAKSQLTLFMAAKVTTGASWPNDEGRPQIGSVVILSCEDDIADTVRPRLEVAGADLARVNVIEAIEQKNGGRRAFSLTSDLLQLERLLDKLGDVMLVIVDPISAYLGGTDTHKNADVRAALAPLQELAARRDIAVVAVSHFTKNAGQGKSINAITGSGAFVAASRATFLVTKDDNDPTLRLFVQAKNNLADAPGLSFRSKLGMTASSIQA
jgi:putative DNA primase/helicase